MYEFTLRYPGHADMMNTLRVLGFFDKKKMSADGIVLEPRNLTLELLKTSMSLGWPEDLLALRVEVKGKSGNNSVAKYQILDYYDSRNGVSAMARTTAYPCTSIALLVGRKKMNRRGVVPPEKIAQDPDMFRFVLSRLRARGIRVRTTGTAS